MTKKSKNTAPKFTVAVDDGYAQTKLYGECPETGKIKKLVVRSTIKETDKGIGSLDGGSLSQYRTPEGGIFTVSKDIVSEDTKFNGFHTSQLNRVLVNHSLITAGYEEQDVSLITGLPVGDYFLNEDIDKEHIEAKRQNLLTPVFQAGVWESKLKLSEVFVGCQAVAAWFDFIFDDDLNKVNEAEGKIAIVDIGGRTTDIAVVVNGTAIDHSVSTTADLGALNVYEALENRLKQEFSLKKAQFPIDELDQTVRTGKIKLWNQEHNVSQLVTDSIGDYQGKIAREVERQIGSGFDLSAVVFVGGGAALFSSITEQFPHGRIVEDPEFSNARGLFKFNKLRNL